MYPDAGLELKYDLHMHSKYSRDGVLEPESIVRIAKSRGLSGVAVTDHNTILGGLKAKEHETDDFEAVIGSEIRTERGEIIGLFLENDIVSREPFEVMKEIRNQNGLVVIPHPFDRLRRSRFVPTVDELKLVDCVEVFNSRCLFQRNNEKALDFATRSRLRMVAGSDAHFDYEIGNAGIETQSEDLKDAIMKGSVKIFGKRSPVANYILLRVQEWFMK